MMIMDLRFGSWQDRLKDVPYVDSIITDPPFSSRVHNGHNSALPGKRNSIDFKPITNEDIKEFVEFWSPRTLGWICILTDHVAAYQWSDRLLEAGRYVFAPIPCVDKGSRVRLRGDGPSSWTTWLIVARRRDRESASWGTLPGAYIRDGKFERPDMTGGKPIWMMRSIIQSYTKVGQIICDPFSGSGTTLIAASIERRFSIGAEADEKTFKKARGRMAMFQSEKGRIQI